MKNTKDIRSGSHQDHAHEHGPDCDHTAIEHDGHVDYLHSGHLHHPGQGQVEEHRLEADDRNPVRCTPDHACSGHDSAHEHGSDCGHETVPHGDHVDYLVDGHLHHPHDGHCDEHGPVRVVD